MTIQSIDYRKSWDRYANTWRLSSAEEKAQECEQVLVEGVVYTDPLTQRTGRGELVAYMLEFHQQIPGGHFKTKEFWAHSGCSVARWDMCAGDGSVVGTGVSYAHYRADGKLHSVTGFFDVPS